MRPRFSDLQDASRPAEDNGEAAPLELAATMAVDLTLAIPQQACIFESQSLGVADTLALCSSQDDAPAHRAEYDSRLREPIAGNHYQHAYQSDGRMQHELGRGGIGRVVLVFDRTLGRDVAMKELLPEVLNEEGLSDADASVPLAQRFLREARITGQLEHPNIVPVYELGRQPSGCLYYTMRVVRGRTLASAIHAATTTTERLALVNHFAGLCQAIAYAHSRGVVHRDIKPDNVMIGEFGETFVLDWGLANIVEDNSPHSLRAAASLSYPPSRTAALSPGTVESFHTQRGSIIGTPLYMSPERLLQSSDASAPTSDVWSLGIVLYYILTGKLPYTANTLGELIVQAQAADTVPISESTDVPRDLIAIARRALTRDPRARYATAREMARDIAAYQAGDKVAAYAYSTIELLRRFARRHRPTLMVTLAALVTLAILGISSYRRIVVARDAALAAERRASLGEQRAKTSLSDVLVERARAESSDGDVASASLLAAGALELLERPDARGMLVALSNADRLEPLPLPDFGHECRQVDWNTALGQLSCSDSRMVTFAAARSQPGTAATNFALNARVYSLDAGGWLLQSDTETAILQGTTRRSIALSTSLSHAAIFASNPRGSAFAISDDSGNLEVWSLSNGERIRTWRATQAVHSIAFHPTDPLLGIGGYRGDVYLWRWQDEPSPTLLGNARSTVRSLAFAPKTGILATGGADGSVLVWDSLQRRLLLAPLRASSTIASVSFSPEGTALAVAMRSGVIDILDTKSYERSLRSSTGVNHIRQLAFTSESELVGVADGAKALSFRIRQAVPRSRYVSRGNVLSLSWAPNAQDILVAGLGDQGLCHLKVSDGNCGDRLPVRAGLVRRVAQAPEQGLFVVAGTGGKVELWDAKQKLPRGYIDVPIPEVRDLAFLGDGGLLAVAGNAPVLVILDLGQMKAIEQQPLPSPVQSLLLLRQRQQLAIGLRNGHVLLRSLKSGELEPGGPRVTGWPVGLAVSERRGWLSVVEDQGRIQFFDLKNLKLIDTLTVGSARLMASAYSEQHDLIATGGEGREIHIVSTARKATIQARLVEHQGSIRTLLFDDANARLYSAGDDGMIRLWTLLTLNQPATELRQALERESGTRIESGRIIQDTRR